MRRCCCRPCAACRSCRLRPPPSAAPAPGRPLASLCCTGARSRSSSRCCATRGCPRAPTPPHRRRPPFPSRPRLPANPGSGTATRTPPPLPPAPGAAPALATRGGPAPCRPGALTALAGASAAHLPLLSALTVQRAAAVGLLGGSVRWPSPRRARRGRGRAAAAGARRGLRVRGGGRAELRRGPGPRGRCAVHPAGRRTEQLEALGRGDALPPLGYDLPFAVTTPAAAARLARTLLQTCCCGRERLRRRRRRPSRPDRAAALGRADADPGAGLGRRPDRLSGARGTGEDEVVPASWWWWLLRGRPAEGFQTGRRRGWTGCRDWCARRCGAGS